MNECPTRVRIGRPAVLADHLGHRPRADQVVDDRRPGLALEHRAGDERGDLRAAHALGPLVDEEHPVGVAVEREPDVRVPCEDLALQVPLVLRVDRVRGMVRERAVELGEQVDERRPAAASNTAGTTSPPMPFAVSATTVSGRIADASTNDRT